MNQPTCLIAFFLSFFFCLCVVTFKILRIYAVIFSERREITPPRKAVDIYSFGVVMWEVWSRRKPWSELSNNQEIFKAVRDEKRALPSPENEDVPDGYDDLMRRCCAYKSNRRPLIDVVRDKLQDLLERAAEIDREKTVHRELTREGSLARSRMMFEMTRRGNDEEETKSSDSSKRRSSQQTNQSSIEGSSLQGNDEAASVQIEMETLQLSNQ